jgi:diaminopimelate decarboxylase
MDHFSYKDGQLYAEDVKISKLAEEFGTPLYIYSSATLRHHYNVMAQSLKGLDTLICFAVKSNSSFAVIRTLAAEGAGADVVSEGEIRRALLCGIPANKIIFSGIGKTAEEMEFALNSGILQFNVESEPELELLSKIASRLGKTAEIAIRVNPDVDAATHGKITTGLKTSKFGIDINLGRAMFKKARALPGIKAASVSVHIGSQITDLTPFEKAFIRVREFLKELEADGTILERVDLGGGLGIPYEVGKNPPHPAAYGEMVKKVFADESKKYKFIFEPGRVLVGNAGILISKVIYVKPTEQREFLIVDAAMNDLIRPSFYSAHHDIIPVIEKNSGTAKYDIVGPVCETGDTFATLREMPELADGDLIAFRSSGAYGAVMASTYNSRKLVAEVMVNGQDYALTSRRQSYDEMFEREQTPEWLKK